MFTVFPGTDDDMLLDLHKVFILVFFPECKTISVSILSQLNSLSARAGYPAVASTMENQHKWLSLNAPFACVSLLWGVRTCAWCVYMRVRQYKPFLPTMLLRLSVNVCAGVRTCMHVWSKSPWQLYPAWQRPIKILLAANEGIAKGDAHTNVAATHTDTHTHTHTHTLHSSNWLLLQWAPAELNEA